MEDTENVCVACHNVENVRFGGCCKALMCHECIQMQTRVTGLCPVCKLPLKNFTWVDLPKALKMHKAISNVRTDKKEKGSAESERARVTRWVRDSLEARMRLNNEEEKKQELTEEDRTWVRESG